MKRTIQNATPRSPFGISLFLLGALLVTVSAWQGFAALRKPATVPIERTSTADAAEKFELRSIENLRPGEQVLALDPETGERAWKTIDHQLVRFTDHLRILTIRSADGSEQTIKTTDEHPFWVPGDAWKDAGALQPGDSFLSSDDTTSALIGTQREEYPEHLTVYNLNIRDLHTYFVAQGPSDLSILVHNADCVNIGKAVGAVAKQADDAADAAKGVKVAKGPFRGGSHGEMTKTKGDGLDSHHMPAAAVNGLPRSKGPAIQMDPKDHARTSSNGQMKGSKKYHQDIERLIQEGRFRDAMAKEIRDVRRGAGEVSGDARKYNEAMKEMLKYALDDKGLLKIGE